MSTTWDSRTGTTERYDAVPVRLTRRGRAVVVLLSVVLLLTAFSLGRVASQASPTAETTRPLVPVVVQPGDTLWSVAQRLAPENDPRQVVDQIRRINDLRGSTLQVGQQLLLPAA